MDIYTHTHNKTGEKNALDCIKLKGGIDDHKIRKYELRPSKDGKLFLPGRSFSDLTETGQKNYMEWIYEVKKKQPG